MENITSIYTLKVKTAEGEVIKKAMDIEALKMFLVEKKAELSIIGMDTEKIPDGAMIYPIMAKAALSILEELEYTVNMALGLIKEEPVEPEPVESEEPEPVPESKPISKPAMKPVVQQPKPVPKPVQPRREEIVEDEEPISESGIESYDDNEPKIVL